MSMYGTLAEMIIDNVDKDRWVNYLNTKFVPKNTSNTLESIITDLEADRDKVAAEGWPIEQQLQRIMINLKTTLLPR